MKHRLDFGEITILPNNIIELIIDDGADITLENIEEIQSILGSTLTESFALLFNNIHHFKLQFDVQITIASHEQLKAIAFIYYDEVSKNNIEKLIELRKIDNWNVKVFSGLELEWQKGVDWLNAEMKR